MAIGTQQDSDDMMSEINMIPFIMSSLSCWVPMAMVGFLFRLSSSAAPWHRPRR